MKIAILGTAYPLRGGLASYNERLAREFLAQNIETKIFTFSLQYPSLFFPGKTQYSDSLPPKDLDIDVCVNSVNPINWICVSKKINKFKPDILIIKFWLPFMGPCFGTVARLVSRNGKTKVILKLTDSQSKKEYVFKLKNDRKIDRNLLKLMKKDGILTQIN